MSLLRNKSYLLLRTGWSISSLGTQLQSFAFSLYIFSVTGSAVQFSVSLCMQILPMILFAPLSGYVSDRFGRKMQIILYDLLSGAAVFLFLGLYFLQNSLKIYQIYLCIFLLSTLQTFFSAVATCLVQSAVEPADYTKQKSVDSTISSLISVFAPAAAGVLYGFFGIWMLLVLNGASFFISAVMEAFLHLPAGSQSRTAAGNGPFLVSIREGIGYLRKSPFIVSFIFTVSALNFILQGVEIGLMAVSQKLMRLSSAVIGIENSALSVGMLGGAVFCGILNKKLDKLPLRQMILGSVIVDAAAYFLIAAWLRFVYAFLPLNANILVFVALNFAIIVFVAVLSINLSARFQKQIPNEIMGRTGSLVSAALTACTPLGQVTAGLLMGGFPYYAAYLTEGAFCVLLILYTFKSRKKPAIITE